MRRAIFVLMLLLPVAAHSAEEAPFSFGAQTIDRNIETYPVEFSREGATLAGTLFLPKNAPTAAVVLIHGSGPLTRMTELARMLTDAGIAALTYDKRGVGASSGSYEGDDNVSARNLALLAGDASLAMMALRSHVKLAGVPAGFLGVSQAGWIAPMAATQITDVRFMGLWSGPVSTTSEELHFSSFAEKDAEFLEKYSPDQIAQFMASMKVRPDDVDPRIYLAKITIPSLWLFGGRDNSIPVSISTSRLDKLIHSGKTNFSYEIFPARGHNLAESPNDPSFIAMIGWITRIARAAR